MRLGGGTYIYTQRSCRRRGTRIVHLRRVVTAHSSNKIIVPAGHARLCLSQLLAPVNVWPVGEHGVHVCTTSRLRDGDRTVRHGHVARQSCVYQYAALGFVTPIRATLVGL